MPPPAADDPAVAADDADALPTSYLDMIRTSPRHHQAFTVCVALQFVTIFIERTFIFATDPYAFSDTQELRRALWFYLVIMLSAFFVSYFAVHSMLTTNAYEMSAFFFSSMILVTRLSLEYASRTDECVGSTGYAVCAAFLSIALFFIIVAAGFTISMYRDLKWKRYKALGASSATHRIYELYERFSAVRKLDFQFSLLTLVTGLCFFVDAPSIGPYGVPALAANVALFFVELVWELAGDYGVKRESRALLGVFWALSGLLPAYIIFLAVEDRSDGRLFSLVTSASTRYTIYLISIINIVLRVVTVAVSVLLFRRFGPDFVPLRRVIEGDKNSKFNRARVAKRADARNAASEGGIELKTRGNAAGPTAGTVVGNPLAVVTDGAGTALGQPTVTAAVVEWAARVQSQEK